MRAALERFKDFVESKFGLALAHGRDDQLVELVSSRADVHRLPLHDYLSWLVANPDQDETATLAKALTVGETYFFRDAAQLEAFASAVVDPWMQRGGRNHLRVLSAGCASGEEPYSLAMLLSERYPDFAPRVVIDAWDVNRDALAKATHGAYTAWSLRETSTASRDRWFTTRGKEYIVRDQIRRSVNFSCINLADLRTNRESDSYYDAVFCRNVLMYFTPEVMSRVVDQLADRLVSDGHLFLGHAETLRNVSHRFVVRSSLGAFYYRRKSERDSPASARSSPRESPKAESATAHDVPWLEAIERATNRVRELSTPSGRPPASTQSASDLRLPMQLLREEQFGKALRALRDLPSGWSRDPDALLLEATLLVNAGELDDAKQACSTLLRTDDLNAGAHYLLGVCCEGAKELDQAFRHHRLAAHLDARFAMPRVHLGLMSRRLGNIDDAKRELHEAIELLEYEDPVRLVLFGGGFSRVALLALCRSELDACGELS